MKNMLVPLDGSPLSQTVLPAVVALSRGGGYAVRLLSVWEVLPEELADVGEAHAYELREQGMRYFRTYLGNVADGLRQKGVEVEIEVRSGHPAAEILALVAETGPDLVAMASRGRGARSGPRGSVADKVLRGSLVPVLVLGPRLLEACPTELRLERVIVPLDGSTESEAALPLAVELANGVGATVSLLRVVTPILGRTWAEMAGEYPTQLDRRRAMDALRYLKAVQARFPDTVRAVHVRCGFPRDELPRFVQRRGFDLVVMASRSRYSPGRWTLGGVAEVMMEGAAPVLLVPPFPITERR